MANKDKYPRIGVRPTLLLKRVFTTGKGLLSILIVALCVAAIIYIHNQVLHLHGPLFYNTGILLLPILFWGGRPNGQAVVALGSKWQTKGALKDTVGLGDKFVEGKFLFNGHSLSWVQQTPKLSSDQAASIDLTANNLKVVKVRKVEKSERRQMREASNLRVIECSEQSGQTVLIAVPYDITDVVGRAIQAQ